MISRVEAQLHLHLLLDLVEALAQAQDGEAEAAVVLPVEVGFHQVAQVVAGFLLVEERLP